MPVSASIGGRVIELDVHENQPVKAGQVLFKLDTRDFDADPGAGRRRSSPPRSCRSQALQAAYQQQLAALKMAERHRRLRPSARRRGRRR